MADATPAPLPLPAMLERCASERTDELFLRWLKPSEEVPGPEDVTFGEFHDRVRRVAGYLRKRGLGPGDRLLILAENSPWWQAVSLAAQLLKVEVAALFASLSSEQARDVLGRSTPRVVAVSSAAQLAKIAPMLGELPSVQLLLALDEELPLVGSLAVEHVDQLDAAGALSTDEARDLAAAVTPSDPFVMVFTSGTTGAQKGVRISQGAFGSGLQAGAEATGAAAGDAGLSFLPWGHIAGQCQFGLALMLGHPLFLVSRRADLPRGFRLGPTYTLSVPLVYDRLWRAVEANIQEKPGPLRAVLKAGVAAARRPYVGDTPRLLDSVLAPLARRLVGGALRDKLGGRFRFFCAGGASSNADLVASLRGLGFPYVDFYGMSETSGVIAFNRRDDAAPPPGSCGKPWPGNDVHLREDGEIVLRGRTLMDGYLDGDDAFDDDGYFATGDLGRLDADGYLYITGRKKSLLILKTGKNVSPEPIEACLATLPEVNEAVALGDDEDFVVAVLFVEDTTRSLVRDGGEAAAVFRGALDGALTQLARHERPKRFALLTGSPQDYPDILTPSFKIKRGAFRERFASVVSTLYGRQAASDVVVLE